MVVPSLICGFKGDVIVNLDCQLDWIETGLGNKKVHPWYVCEGIFREDLLGEKTPSECGLHHSISWRPWWNKERGKGESQLAKSFSLFSWCPHDVSCFTLPCPHCRDGLNP
jgi:hypothetical protein